MLTKTHKTYQKEIIEKYDFDYGEGLSNYLVKPSPAKIRKACLNLFNKSLSRADKQIFEDFFEEDNMTVNVIKNFDLDRFKPVGSLLKKKTKTADHITIELISILVDFKPRPLSNYLRSSTSSTRIAPNINPPMRAGIEQETNINKERNPAYFKIGRLKVISIGIFILFGLIIFYNFYPFNSEQTASTEYNKILASNLFSDIRTFKAKPNQDQDIVLIGLNYYSWQQQYKTSIALDSMVVKLTVRNNSNQRFYMDRLILKTIKKSKMTKMTIKNSCLFISPNINIAINPNEVPQDYVFKIIKDDLFDHLPPNAETDITVTVKGSNVQKNELVYFKFQINGHNANNPMYIESKETYLIGFENDN